LKALLLVLMNSSSRKTNKSELQKIAVTILLAAVFYGLQFLLAFLLPGLIQLLFEQNFILGALVTVFGFLPLLALAALYQKLKVKPIYAALGFFLLAIAPSWQIWGQSFLPNYLIGSILNTMILGFSTYKATEMISKKYKNPKSFSLFVGALMFVVFIISGFLSEASLPFLQTLHRVVAVPQELVGVLSSSFINQDSGIGTLLFFEFTQHTAIAYYLLVFTTIFAGRSKKGRLYAAAALIALILIGLF